MVTSTLPQKPFLRLNFGEGIAQLNGKSGADDCCRLSNVPRVPRSNAFFMKTISCHMAGKDEIFHAIEKSLNIKNIGDKFAVKNIEFNGNTYTLDQAVKIGLDEIYKNYKKGKNDKVPKNPVGLRPPHVRRTDSPTALPIRGKREKANSDIELHKT